MDANFFKRLNGNVAAGLSFTKSSGIGQVTFSANIQYATKLVNYQLISSSISSIDTGNFSRDNENVQLLASYDLTPTWFIGTAAPISKKSGIVYFTKVSGNGRPGQ